MVATSDLKSMAPLSSPVPAPPRPASEQTVTVRALINRLSAPNVWPTPRQAAVARHCFHLLAHWRQESHKARLIPIEASLDEINAGRDTPGRAPPGSERPDQQIRHLLEQLETSLELLGLKGLFQVDGTSQPIEPASQIDNLPDLSFYRHLRIYGRGPRSTSSSNGLAQKAGRSTTEREPVFDQIIIVAEAKSQDELSRDIAQRSGVSAKRAVRAARKTLDCPPLAAPGMGLEITLFGNATVSSLHSALSPKSGPTRTRNSPRPSKAWAMALTGTCAISAAALVWFGVIPAALATVALAGGMTWLLSQSATNAPADPALHILARNHAALHELSRRSALDDIKDELLLYSILAKHPAGVHDLDEMHAAIERYLQQTFSSNVRFDIDEALKRLMQDGIVRKQPDGTLDTLTPDLAVAHLKTLWDIYLEKLPHASASPGRVSDWRRTDRG